MYWSLFQKSNVDMSNYEKEIRPIEWENNILEFEEISVLSNDSSLCSTKEGFVRVTVMKSETIELVR